MSKKATRVICIVLAVLLLVGIVSMIAGSRAYAVTQAEIDKLQEERDEIRRQKNDIQEQITALQTEMASVIDKKSALDAQNELNRQDIEIINEQIALYDAMIEEKALEVADAVAAEEEQYAHYCARVRSMEETNNWTYMSFIFNAKSLTDFLGRINDVTDIVRNDQHIKDEYIAAREAVEQVKAEYEAIQAQQEEKRAELLEEKAKLEAQIEAATRMISELENDIEAFTEAYEANEALENEVQEKIDKKVAELAAQKAAEEAARKAWEESQRKLREQQAAAAAGNKSSGGTTVASGAGYYAWPVPSCTYITSRFGYRVHPIFGTTKYHSGVDIAAGAGSAINAAAGGTVSIAEYSDSYGYYCVIYHSNGTTTLYAHMNSMPVVSVGQTVSAGQLIGYVGSTGWSTGPHCHFEIRVNGSCVDPLSYFPGVGFTYASDA
jgi:murein DD-endopeptidase MepM/ murein hydrolase activator NlpD